MLSKTVLSQSLNPTDRSSRNDGLGGHGLMTDVRVTSTQLYLISAKLRTPLKFGNGAVEHIQCLRVRLTVSDSSGRKAEGWGETPLSAQWAWPSMTSYESRLASMVSFSHLLADAWSIVSTSGHPMEIGYDFIQERLPALLREHNSGESDEIKKSGPMPYLAAIVCCSAFDIALHDAFGVLHEIDVYDTYNSTFMRRDLASFLEPAEDVSVSFKGKYPEDYFVANPPRSLAAWHLVGGLDPVDPEELHGNEPKDGYPILLPDWIERDGLNCLKIKLKGNDAAWDYERLVRVGRCAMKKDVQWLSADFNCCVSDPAYVNEILDRLKVEHTTISEMLLYVEQPFPYELREYPIDVRSIAKRKQIFLDESAHDWQNVRLGRSLGWTGVALKTCKTQTGALLSLCWAKAHGMPVMVQDLTNPMLAQISHVRLAAHAGTICGVETNAPQFCPIASEAEANIHPGLYTRRNGTVDLSTISGPGFGYRVAEINRTLPEPELLHSL